MMLGDDLKIRFYDLGGGKKIRDIWEQYYHDAHGYIYVFDSAATPEDMADSAEVYRKVAHHPFLKQKPGLVLANKQDKSGAASVETIKQMLAISQSHDVQIKDCSCATPDFENTDVVVTDPRLEAALLWLLDQIRGDYANLNDRVLMDTAAKEVEEAAKRVAKERMVLRNKIACAFLDQFDRSVPGVNVESANPNDLFGDIDGPKFLAGEIGVEVQNLDPIAAEVAALIGYQRLALQMVGGMNVPVSKKKVPVSWLDIRSLVMELRAELGLSTAME